jgi:hypothetical protein
MFDLSGCSVEKQAIGEIDQRVLDHRRVSNCQAGTIEASQLRAVITDGTTKSADSFRRHFRHATVEGIQ